MTTKPKTDTVTTSKKILLVFAHPERQSLNGALRDVAVRELQAQGHEVKVSDLYDMGWKAAVDQADFPLQAAGDRLVPVLASKQGFETGMLTDDVKAEIEKLLWADMLILQFPLWWFGMPAILKGWVDRVYAYGFAYGVGEHSDKHWGDRYGEGVMTGKRAMLIVTAGGWEDHYSARGINGPIDDLLFPITHGTLYYPGYQVLPSFVAYRVDGLDATGFEVLADKLRVRLRGIETAAPIPYRQQNGGDYLIPSMKLRLELGDRGASGFALHLKGADARDSSSMADRLVTAE
ncbi:MAG TPA: NAD(P)H-dependent oxidoreductase [Dongiaceae bacterium]|nr:NAD(P)H-dependent oxidoreductase [Dongiaceae bacterium]